MLLFFLEKPSPQYKHYFRNFLFVLAPLLFIYVFLWDSINNHYPPSSKTGFLSSLSSFIMNEPHFDYVAWSPYHKVNYVASPRDITLFYDNIQHTKIVKPSYRFDLDDVYANIKDKSHVLIIGPGGGRDINAFVRMHDSKSITAVELEPLAVKLAHRFSEYAPYLYDTRTRYLIGEGRHFLNKGSKAYTAIVFPSTDSFSAIAPQSLIKLENYLYTVEAFKDVCDRLTRDGTLVVSLWSSLQHYLSDMVGADSEFRTVALRLYRNISEVVPRKENIVIADSGYRTPYVNSRIVMLYAKSGIDRETIRRSFRTSDTILTDDPKFIDAAEKTIPTTDDRPFFYIRDKRIPLIIKMSIAYLLLITCAALGPFLTKAISQTQFSAKRMNYTLIPYFFCTGVGFMLITNVLVHKFLISFGAPYLSSTAVIVTMLMGAGCGSLIVANIRVLRPRIIWLSFCLLILSLLGLHYCVKSLNMFLPHLGLVHRTLVVTVLLFPFAILVGVPFPVGLNRLREISRQGVVIAYSLDVLGAIIGIVLSLVIPIWFNYSAVFSLIALVYILLFLLWFVGMFRTEQE
jgi:spermidine synthase